MATLNKLSLSGVRSFGPDSCDEQRIYFEKPFNLILGRNGCGKTTIIEALKYSCSGTMPAGQGANLVRDPKLDKQAETRAQIKMNFQSGRGEDCTITRSMSSKIKGGKALEFKTVDTVIQVINKNGKPEHLAGRCADMDDLMIKLLGVSKPILNYVIFCHQEDSHWPLDEGKKLKEKFDEIFDSTKYNKCMNEVRKLRKAAIDEKKVAEVSLKHLESDVETLKQKRGELLLLHESFSKMEENLQVFQKEILSYEEENIVWRRKYKDYEKSKSERDDAKNQLSKLMYEQETEKKHITHFFTGSEAELQIEIRSFDDQLQLKQEASTRILRRIEKLSDLESQKKTQSLDIQKLICKLEADKEQEQKIKMDRNLKLSHLARSFELSGLPADATEEDVDQLHHQVKRKFQTLVNSISAMKLQQEKEQNDLQEEINRCIQIKAKIESEIQVKEGNVSSNDAEILTLKGKLRSVNESLKKKQQIDRELEDSREKRVKASKNEDSEALAIKIDELQQLCSSLEKRQNELSTELVELLKYQGTQKSLQTQEEKHKDALTQIQRLRCKNEDSISKLLGNSTDGTLKQDFDRLLQKLKREIDQLKNLKSEKNGEISSLDLNRNHKKSSLEKKQANLQTKKESLFKLCGKKKLDEVLNAIETEMDSLQNDKGLFTSTQIVLSGYVKQLKGDPCCPLCRRNFTDDHDASVLADEITESMNNLPGRVEVLNEKLSKLQQKQRSLLQLKPVEKEVMDLESEIPSLQNDVLGLEGVLDATREELRDVEERLQSPEADLRTAEDIQNVIFDIDRYHKESKLCARQIDNLRRELSHLSSASRTSEQCAAEQQLISDELSAKRREKDGVEKCQRDYLNILNTFDQQINKLVSQQLEIKEFVQQEDAMKERLTELSHVNDTIQTEIKDLSQKLKPASEKKRNAEDALETTKEKHKRKIQEIENMKQEREMSIRLLTETKETLNNFRSRKISESLEFNKEAHQKLINEINHLETEHDDLAKQSNDLQETLGEHSKRKKELEGNMTVLKLSKQIKKQEEVLEMAEKKLGDTDAKGVINKINDIEGKISDVKCQVNELKGNKRGLEDNIKSRKEELQEDRYRNAERKYKEKFVKLTVLSHTEKDLQKYYNALDTAMQHFHRDRMASVNKLIRELWRLIYRGNDTDFIEIKTDESALGSASNATDKKRNYNYRVVQVKNGTEIDMRGRCSAGQKVLASLIIRLALAETFSANCGILALDEPTTNLDKDNIRSLCHAIVEIVHEREQTSNFQLICITHDHEFLEMMTDMDFFSHYWEVSRDHRSKSVIKKRAVCKE